MGQLGLDALDRRAGADDRTGRKCAAGAAAPGTDRRGHRAGPGQSPAADRTRTRRNPATDRRRLEASLYLRWPRFVGQFGGFAELGSGSRQAANVVPSSTPAPIDAYDSIGV